MRLRRSDLTSEGITRRRRGKGFSYQYKGRPVTEPETLERIRGLVIPPAWRQVWISPDPSGHIQAVGVDAAGRKQYLYHAQWRSRRDREKFDHMLEVAAALAKVRRRVSADLNGKAHRGGGDISRRRVLAAAVRLLDSAALRIGGESYAQDDPVLGDATFGLATLRRDHVRISGGDRISFSFPAKGAATIEFEVTDPELAAVLKPLLGRRDENPELLAYNESDNNGNGNNGNGNNGNGKEGNGKEGNAHNSNGNGNGNEGTWHDIRGEHINAYLREISGLDLTAKDFRTWAGTVAAAISLANAPQPPEGKRASVTAQRRAIAQAMREVAERLGNTPAVARKSYVDERLLDLYRDGTTISATQAADWQRAQRAVLKMLKTENGNKGEGNAKKR